MDIPADTGWRDISEKPERDCMVLLFFGKRRYAPGWSENEPIRDERYEVGYWTDGEWRETGTGHDVFEAWKTEDDLPTLWQPITPPQEPNTP